MSKSEQFDLQLNRRQMLLMSGAACACGAWGRSAFAQANQQFQGCVEVEPWYTVQLKRNPNAPQTIAAANQLSAVRAQSLLQGGQGGGQVAAALGGNVPRSRVASGLNQAARNQVSFALQQHLNGQASSPSSAQGRPLQAIVARTKLWPRTRTVTFGFIDGGGLQADIRAAFAEWKRHTCLDLQFTQDVSSASIRVSFRAGAGHYSLVGVDSNVKEFSPNFSGSFESLNLDPTGGDAAYLTGTALHEVGHAIGFVHEHQNPSGGINWDQNAVFAYFRQTQSWDDQTILDNILSKLNDTTQYAFTARDAGSVMHYFFPQSLAPGSTVPSRPNLVLSSTDKSFAEQQYGCAGSPGDGSPAKPEEAKPIITDRQKLKPENAKTLKAENSPKKHTLQTDPPMDLYKIRVDDSHSYVFETVDGARLETGKDGKVTMMPMSKNAIPMILELFDGTDFSEEKVLKNGISKFGVTGAKAHESSIGVQDAFLSFKLQSKKDYYLVARPQQRPMKDSKWTYTLLVRKSNELRSKAVKGQSWSGLKGQIETTQAEIKKTQGETKKLLESLRK